MRRWLKRFLQMKLREWYQRLQPKPDLRSENRLLTNHLNDLSSEVEALRHQRQSDAAEFMAEMIEARQMAGAGPWRSNLGLARETDVLIRAAAESARSGVSLKEAVLSLREDLSTPPISAGAYGDIELALQNVEWRREINLSFLEFSRWGIQQIILISRLHYIKNPWIQRGVNIAASYVFGRGVEISSPNEAANDVLRDYFDRNKETLGQIALTDLQRRKYYDGNIFFVSFPDDTNGGTVETRTIDSTEVMEIVTDPNDVDRPWLYKRQWTQNVFDAKSGSMSTKTQEAWYPSLQLWLEVKGLSDKKPREGAPGLETQEINGKPVMWNAPIHHRKCGGIAKWHFGCPLVYAALDWAKTGRKFLEACATVKQALAQIAFTLTTKGGQQAIEGAKQQLSTTVGPQSSLWDTNPTAVNASVFASGTGTNLQAFKTTGAGGDPSEVKEYRNMVACVLRVPPTYLADMETSNLATATTLDRPTELGFLEMQEEWREDLVTLARFALLVSKTAASGRIRESINQAKDDPGAWVIREAARRMDERGTMVYSREAAKPKEIQVLVTFPAIREGDLPLMISAIVEAMTLGGHSGQVVGIDERAGVFELLKYLGIEGAEELLDKMYPTEGTDAYNPDRTVVDVAPPLPKVNPGGAPQAPGGNPTADPGKVAEAFTRLVEVLQRVRSKKAA